MNQQVLTSGRVRLFLNPAADGPQQAYRDAHREILSRRGFEAAREVISTWPGHAETRLHALPGLARALGLGRIDYKDESTRFGLGSFKALGGAYAVNRLLLREISQRTGRSDLTFADLSRPEFRAVIAGITVSCATDGNHGRSVAWGAHNAGCACTIYIHETVSRGREEAIAAFGATVVRVPGNYDDAVRRAAEDAAEHGYFVVSDTSYPGYMDVPRDVMQGYSVMVQEALDQLGDAPAPTHVFIQAGVGGLAAAVTAHLWETLGPARPRVIVVEPEQADCLYQSALAGKPVAVGGDLDTVMAGLACGEVSLLAWELLHPGAFAFMVVPDDAALDVMRRLATSDGGDPPIVAGESAVAGVAACMAAALDPAMAAALGLGPDSRVLFFASEGDTDPELYRQITGRTAAEVRSGAAS